MDNEKMMNEGQMKGGRRHRGSKKRRGNASLRAWVTFVKKVQREEKVSYKEAMMRAKKRKDKGEKWRGGGDDDDYNMNTSELTEDMDNSVLDDEDDYDNDDYNMSNSVLDGDDDNMYGGKRRRRTRRHRGSKKRKHGRKSRRHR
jgi:hypothetical protein